MNANALKFKWCPSTNSLLCIQCRRSWGCRGCNRNPEQFFLLKLIRFGQIWWDLSKT